MSPFQSLVYGRARKLFQFIPSWSLRTSRPPAPFTQVLQLQQSIHARGGPAPPFQRLLCGPRELGATESLSSLREEDTTLQLLVVVPEGRPCDVRRKEDASEVKTGQEGINKIKD